METFWYYELQNGETQIYISLQINIFFDIIGIMFG